MSARRLPESECRQAYEAVLQHGTVKRAADALGMDRMTVQHRYASGLKRYGWDDVRATSHAIAYNAAEHPLCALTDTLTMPDCVALAFSDAHWTTLDQPRSLAHEAMLAAIPSIKPDLLLSVGDLLDFGEPSRHAPVMWQPRIRVRSELDAARQHLSDIVALAPKAQRRWVRGNHDDRYDKWLAANASSFEDVDGFALADKFPDWRMCWRLNLNDAVVVHRIHGGIHAAWNNVVKSGVTIISGDTHSLEVKPMVDMRGRRYGVQLGMLGDPAWPCFSYSLGITRLWNPGFAVLTWREGRLMPPELCEGVDGVAWFRGKALVGKPRVRVQAIRG